MWDDCLFPYFAFYIYPPSPQQGREVPGTGPGSSNKGAPPPTIMGTSQPPPKASSSPQPPHPSSPSDRHDANASSTSSGESSSRRRSSLRSQQQPRTPQQPSAEPLPTRAPPPPSSDRIRLNPKHPLAKPWGPQGRAVVLDFDTPRSVTDAPRGIAPLQPETDTPTRIKTPDAAPSSSLTLFHGTDRRRAKRQQQQGGGERSFCFPSFPPSCSSHISDSSDSPLPFLAQQH